MVCTGIMLYKNIVTLTGRRSMFYPSWLSLRIFFLWQLLLRLFSSFSLTWDSGSCSDHIFDS
jgi:hypothetical protein